MASYLVCGGPPDRFDVKAITCEQMRRVADYHMFVVDNYEENFRYVLLRVNEPYDTNDLIDTIPFLFVQDWPMDFEVDEALFLAYRSVNKTYKPVHAFRSLYASTPCYARYSRWTLACMPTRERMQLCDGNEGAEKVSPEALVIVQDAFFGFFIETWDRFAWRCWFADKTPSYEYGTAFPAFSNTLLEISEKICEEALILLPMNFPYIKNFSYGVNPYVPSRGSHPYLHEAHVIMVLLEISIFLAFLNSPTSANNYERKLVDRDSSFI